MNSDNQGIFTEESKARPGLSKAKIIFFASIIFVVAILIFASSYWSETIEIKEISVVGNKYYPKKIIVDKVYSHVLSHKLSDVNFNYIRGLILKDPFIKGVEFITTYPEKVIISITPKYLLAIGSTFDGQSYYLTDEGEMIKKGVIRLGYTLPVVDFERIGKNRSKKNLIEISDFLKNYYKTAEQNIKAQKIWKDKNGICFSIRNDIVVRIGNLANIEEKFCKFETYFKEQIEKSDIIPGYIDLRWANQVVTN
jgi:cell division septal protein FtsQ